MIFSRFLIPASVSAKLKDAYDTLAQELPKPFTPEFPAAVVDDTQAAIDDLTNDPYATGRDGIDAPRTDLTHLPFVTIDPAGATDLDQAMFLTTPATDTHNPNLTPAGDGLSGGTTSAFRVYYAIADVGRFITPGGPLDATTRERGQTIYLPDRRIPLHPPALSEGAASLLPGKTRAAYVFIADLDEAGELVTSTIVRAVVRSTEQLDYTTVQQAHEDGQDLHPSLALLPDIGHALQQAAKRRGAIDLAIPDQEVTESGNSYTLAYRPRGGIEDYNAQISLLAGRIAAHFLLQAGHGILRTLPTPSAEAIDEFYAVVRGLGFEVQESYQATIRRIDHQGTDPRALAVHYASPILFRGAGYTLIEPGQDPEDQVQSAVGAPYAHATAPLRRLVDRYVLPMAEACAQGTAAPTWALDGLAGLPEIMQDTGRVARDTERHVLERTEAVMLAGAVGRQFTGVVVGSRETKDNTALVEVHVPDPAVVVWAAGEATVGTQVTIELDRVDEAAGKLFFTVVGRSLASREELLERIAQREVQELQPAAEVLDKQR